MTYLISYPVADPAKAVVSDLDRPLDEALEALPADWDGRGVSVEEQMRDVPLKTVVALYNRACPDAQVSKFENRSVAGRRTFPVLGLLVREDRGTTAVAVTSSDAAASMDRAINGDEKKGSPAKGKRLGIGARMRELISEGVEPKVIVEKIQEEFPMSRATTRDVAIVRRKMKEDR